MSYFSIPQHLAHGTYIINVSWLAIAVLYGQVKMLSNVLIIQYLNFNGTSNLSLI